MLPFRPNLPYLEFFLLQQVPSLLVAMFLDCPLMLEKDFYYPTHLLFAE